MTADDKEMAGKLQQMLPDIDGEDLFNSIQKAKTDKSGKFWNFVECKINLVTFFCLKIDFM